jgi:hypothetical protein
MIKTQNQYLPEDILIPFFGDNAIVGVEIGILGASGSVAMLNRMPLLKLYCIDPWMNFPGHEFEAERSQEWHDEMYAHSVNRLKEFESRVVILRMTSDEAWNHVNEPLDFVHIDGDHRYVQVKRDMELWQKKLKSRAILGGHDWQIDHIKQAVREVLGEVQTGEDFTWWKVYG